MIIFGQLEDNINLLTIPYLYRIFGSYFIPWFGHPVGKYFEYYESNQPLMWIPFIYLSRILDPIVVYNIYVLLAKILLLVFSYLFFNRFIKSHKISFFMALVFIFHPYLEYQSRSHIDLAQIWVFPLFFYILYSDFKFEYKKSLLLGALTFLITMISNYLGFFVLLFYAIHSLVSVIVNRSFTKNKIYDYFLYLISFSVPTLLALYPYIVSNYFTDNIEIVDTKVVRNGIEDFFYFSTRPWYYFLPSVDNPFFGNISSGILKFLQDDWGYWLTNNYFVTEHSSSYVGWLPLSMGLLGVLYLLKKFEEESEKQKILFFILTCLLLVLFTMPPYFTFGELKVYMPSYILMLVFPMFRSVARLGPIIVLSILLLAGLGYKYVELWMKKSSMIVIKNSFFAVLIIFSFVNILEYYIPFRVTHYNNPPFVYTYIAQNTPQNSVIVHFPYNKSGEVTFWMREFNRSLVNPVGFNTATFASQDFTDDLISCEGIENAIKMGATHLLFFPDIGKDKHIATSFFEIGLKLEPVYFYEKADMDNSFEPSKYLIKKNINGENDSVRLYDLSKVNTDGCR